MYYRAEYRSGDKTVSAKQKNQRSETFRTIIFTVNS